MKSWIFRAAVAGRLGIGSHPSSLRDSFQGIRSRSPMPQELFGFVRQLPDDLSRRLDALHSTDGLPGPQGHRVEVPRRPLVSDERVTRVHGNADPGSPRLRGLADELSLEPLDRFDAGPQDAMGRVRPIRGERLREERVLRLRGDELVDVRGMGPRLLHSDEPRAHPDRRGAGREGCGHGPPGPIPPAATTGTLTDGRTSLRSARSPIFPRTWPPASVPWATIRSQPARSAATASAAEPSCQEPRAPPAWAISTSSGSGSS